MVAEVLYPDFVTVEYSEAIEEIDALVPKYLKAVEKLKADCDCNTVHPILNNVVSYWKRMKCLLQQVQDLEVPVDFDSIVKNSLQLELTLLEEVYFKVQASADTAEFSNDEMGRLAVEKVLLRMDNLLSEIGFLKDHEDRRLMQQLLVDNQLKRLKR